jgi:hypothetical protein
VPLSLTTFKPCYCVCMCCPHAFAPCYYFHALLLHLRYLLPTPPLLFCCICTLLPCALCVNKYSLPNFLCK